MWSDKPNVTGEGLRLTEETGLAKVTQLARVKPGIKKKKKKGQD